MSLFTCNWALCCFTGWSNTSLFISVHYAMAGLYCSKHLQTGYQETPKASGWRCASSPTQIAHAEVRHTHAHSLSPCLSLLFSVLKSFVAGSCDYFQTVIGAFSMNKDLLWCFKSTIGFWLKFIQNLAGSAALKSNRAACLFNVMYQGCCF